MNTLIVRQSRGLGGQVSVPGDKSISHRALMLGALAEGVSRVRNFLPAGDCLATLGCLRALGIEIERHDETTLTVHGRGLRGFQSPVMSYPRKRVSTPIDSRLRGNDGNGRTALELNCVRSGTTMRLLAGILAGQSFDSVLIGDAQLLRRPMRRVVEPLRQMGAQIDDLDGRAPLHIRGTPLHGYDHTLKVASAQVKSALLLAGLYADGPTVVREPGPGRDHTERMLKAQIANHPTTQPPNHPTTQHALVVDGLTVTLNPALIDHLEPLNITVPGDFSSAAFLLVAATLVSGSDVTVEGVGINPTRTGLLDVLRQMGAEIAVENECEQGGEPVADLTVRSANLTATTIQGDTVVRMIDEFPVLAVAATQAEGQTVVRDARELRVKETDRIATTVEELCKLGANIAPTDDGFIVNGPTPLRGTVVDSHGDHRLAMALAVAGLIAEGETVVENTECISDSFPGFEDVICEA